MVLTKHGVFHPFAPKVDDVRIEDIAYSLANSTRFNGHIPISVAQHSVRVYELSGGNIKGLLHDAAEAYIGDHVSPLKEHTWYMVDDELIHISEVEKRILNVVFEWAGLPLGIPKSVKIADKKAMEEEMRKGRYYWSAADAEKAFMAVWWLYVSS